MQRETNFEGTPAAAPSPLTTEDPAGRDMLRFLTCGSVDDGKSTLIGRLLHDSQVVLDDQMAALSADSKQIGTTGGDIDFALLVDGLQAEREQGITIDVAYRYFATQRRKFIVADTPGHEQYTRNMATGASNCDLAVILVDARKGILSQTRRHSIIAHLLGIRHVVLAVNKMDLVGHSQSRFDAIVEDYLSFSRRAGITGVVAIPVVATSGDNILAASTAMPWHAGPTLMAHLETVDVSRQEGGRPLRLPVQWVNRPDLNFRGFSGSVTRGSLRVGDAITVLPSARPSNVSRIVGPGGDREDAAEGDAVTVVLADEVDVSRGDVIVAPEDRPEVADQVAADIVWMGDEPMFPGRPYWVRCGTQSATATVTALKYKLNVDNLDHIAGRQLELNEIAMCNLSFSRPLVFEPYEVDRAMGSFILIDRITNATVAAGMIRFGLRRATNVHWQALAIDRATRAAQKNQSPACLWFTGLSGSGKSTIANLLEKRLHACGNHTFILDGDNVRHGLNKDLGFTDTDRVENIRRVGEMAKLMTEAGLIVLVSFISPFREERRLARELFQDGEFLEIFVDAPLQACEERDPKGLYKKARAGQIRNFTGIDSAYERPEHAEMRLATAERPAEDLVEDIITELRRRGIIGISQQ